MTICKMCKEEFKQDLADQVVCNRCICEAFDFFASKPFNYGDSEKFKEEEKSK